MTRTKQRGYVLLLVLILSFLMATAVLAAFAVVYRYELLAKRDIERLRSDVIAEETATAQETGAHSEGLSWTS